MMMEPVRIKDIVGNVVEVGDIVAYPVQTTQGLKLSSARVTHIISEGAIRLEKTRDDDSLYRFTFTRLDRIAVVAGV